MTETDVGAVLREAIIVMLKLGGPLLGVALVVGVLVALLQAITSINESAMSFVPKVLALLAALALLGPFILGTLRQFALVLFDRLVLVGGT
jgi:flagellar biosynthetic protein FliQ